MSFRHASFTDVDIDDVVATIFNELKNNGGWSEIDSGYKVLRNPGGTFEIFFFLEATNKRYLSIQVGEDGQWNTGTHVMDAPYLESGMIFLDQAGAAAGTEQGNIELSYDEDVLIIYHNYEGETNGRECMGYYGECVPLTAGDEMVTCISNPYRGTSVTPPYDIGAAGSFKIIRDVAGVASEKAYYPTCLSATGGSWTSGCPQYMRMFAVKQNVRYLVPIYLYSDSSLSSGEEAGIRGYMKYLYHGGAHDDETSGETLEAADGNEFKYWWYGASSYYSFPMRNWRRIV